MNEAAARSSSGPRDSAPRASHFAPDDDYLRRTLDSYETPLLRSVCQRLFKPRNQWPKDELIERSLATLENAAVVDRRLADLGPAERRLLAVIGKSRQPSWKLGSLLELLAALGHAEGIKPVLSLFEQGLLYPDLFEGGRSPVGAISVRNFEQWLGQAGATGYRVFAHPLVTARAMGEDLGLPDLGVPLGRAKLAPQEADGLEWLLRLAVVWQQVKAGPLRRTQQGGFFKRDLERLQGDPLLGGTSPDQLSPLPDHGLLAVALAERLGILNVVDGELHADRLPANWQEGLLPTLLAIWLELPDLDSWDPREGWRSGPSTAHPYPAAYLLALLLLARLTDDGWARPEFIEEWIARHHPFWSADKTKPKKIGIASFLLGFAYSLRLVQAAKGPDDHWHVRLSAVGRWLLGLEGPPQVGVGFPKTLLVQPNLEIIAYRQGLTPALIAQLSLFAAWKGQGGACTLQLGPETVYRALETGQTFDSIRQSLENHGMRALPPAVLDSLRTWADKRERITLYPSATIFEFASAQELNDALARGLPGTAITDRLAVVPRESEVDFRHYRLTATRDYGLPPEQCLDVETDGVTVAIDPTRSDLLVDTELLRFAEPIEPPSGRGDRRARWFRLTPASLTAARESGLTLRQLDEWFQQRSGHPLSAAARLLLIGSQMPPARLQRHLVLTVPTAEIADGLLQWPQTGPLIHSRLGPTALAVAEEQLETLRCHLRTLGIGVTD